MEKDFHFLSLITSDVGFNLVWDHKLFIVIVQCQIVTKKRKGKKSYFSFKTAQGKATEHSFYGHYSYNIN